MHIILYFLYAWISFNGFTIDSLDMNGRFYMILILGKNISQYMQGSALHKHRTFYIAISPGMNTLDHGEILLFE
jgi:hypothetical protein